MLIATAAFFVVNRLLPLGASASRSGSRGAGSLDLLSRLAGELRPCLGRGRSAPGWNKAGRLAALAVRRGAAQLDHHWRSSAARPVASPSLAGRQHGHPAAGRCRHRHHRSAAHSAGCRESHRYAMPEAMLLLAVFVAAYLGFAALAVSQDRHWHHLGGGRHCPRRTSLVLRCAGWTLLLAAFAGGAGARRRQLRLAAVGHCHHRRRALVSSPRCRGGRTGCVRRRVSFNISARGQLLHASRSRDLPASAVAGAGLRPGQRHGHAAGCRDACRDDNAAGRIAGTRDSRPAFAGRAVARRCRGEPVDPAQGPVGVGHLPCCRRLAGAGGDGRALPLLPW